MNDAPDATARAKAPRYTRRLSDKVLIAFHQACDQGDFEVCEQLLVILEGMARAPRPLHHGRERRREQETLIAAHERLWHLRHPDPRRVLVTWPEPTPSDRPSEAGGRTRPGATASK